LICVALLLAKESIKIPKDDIKEVPFKSVCRTFKLGKDRPSNVLIQNGINFDLHPSLQHTDFHSLTQVGTGSTAVLCCLAVASDASVCALKIFRETSKTMKNSVNTELSNCQALYKDQNWTFMRMSEVSGTYVLMLPFLNVPGNTEDRQSFLVGATEQDTLL